jgi:hypothetical protein
VSAGGGGTEEALPVVPKLTKIAESAKSKTYHGLTRIKKDHKNQSYLPLIARMTLIGKPKPHRGGAETRRKTFETRRIGGNREDRVIW